jgi:pre-mRNA-splicing factor ATP-dependent RNA helicase DHX15/PRP43
MVRPFFLRPHTSEPESDLPFHRLLEFAAVYYDLASFPDGETKRALTRVNNKRLGKADARFEQKEGANGASSSKKRRKN